MGEFAKRISDGERVKIGTCETMYYLRYEDRRKVEALPGNVDVARDPVGLFFRVPFPDEDDVRVGEYAAYERGLRLSRKVVTLGTQPDSHEDFRDEETAKVPGIMQMRHEASGLLLTVPCYHGVKLPEVVAPMKTFWSGKGHALELAHLKATADGVLPVVRCRFCGFMWRYQWSDIWEYLQPDMQERMRCYLPVAGVSA